MTITQFKQKLVITTFSNRVTIRNGAKGIRIALIERGSYDKAFRNNPKNLSDLFEFLFSFYFGACAEQERDGNNPYYIDNTQFNQLVQK